MPYREVDHTADWALHVWAPTLAELFVDAARGMYALTGALVVNPGAAARRTVEVRADHDDEALLVSWLQELLYLTESESLIFDDFHIETLTPDHLRATVVGTPGSRPEKVIKAVTYHALSLRPTEAGYAVTIVFDV